MFSLLTLSKKILVLLMHVHAMRSFFDDSVCKGARIGWNYNFELHKHCIKMKFFLKYFLVLPNLIDLKNLELESFIFCAVAVCVFQARDH